MTSYMISDEVVARVKKTAKQLNYMTDFAAASLKNQRSYTVGIVIPDILNPVFPPIIKGIQEYLAKDGYVVFIVYSNNDRDAAIKEIRTLVGRRVDGIIIASAFLDDSSVEYCLKQDIPLVAVNRSIREGHLIHQVLDNDEFGISLSVDYLKSLGHRYLVHFAGPQDISHGIQRRQAFEKCCQAGNLACDVIQANSFSVESGMQAAAEFLAESKKATAIIAGNDLIAVGAIKHLQACGIDIPADISITGFNDMPFAGMLNPALTTVRIPHEQLGQQAARLLLNAMEDVGGPKQKVLLTPSLKIRNSTARAK